MKGIAVSLPASTEEPGTPDTASIRGGQVVGVDGSAGSTHALRWAVNNATSFGDVQPIVAWQYPWWGMGTGMAVDPMPPPPEDFAAAAQATARHVLDTIDRSHISPAIVCRSNAGPALVEFGASGSLIVVGTRGHGALAGTLLGSVSTHVVAHARTPVAVVPIDASDADLSSLEDAAAVVGIDGSPNSIAALRWALEFLPRTITIKAVHAWGATLGTTPELITLPLDEFETQARTTLDACVDAALADHAGASEDVTRIERVVAFGDPRSVLREQAEHATILVLGARGHRGIAHLLLGSVTTGLVHHPNAVTVVIPAG